MDKPVKVTTPLAEMGWTFPLFGRLARDFGWPFSRFGHDRFMFEPTETFWNPDVEMFERNNELFVRVDVPGLKKEDITIEVTDEELVLRGERKREKEEKGEGYYRSERSYGSFYRALPLPEGAKIDQAKAVVRDGVLEVKMPMAKIETKARRLEIHEPAATERSAKHAA